MKRALKVKRDVLATSEMTLSSTRLSDVRCGEHYSVSSQGQPASRHVHESLEIDRSWCDFSAARKLYKCKQEMAQCPVRSHSLPARAVENHHQYAYRNRSSDHWCWTRYVRACNDWVAFFSGRVLTLDIGIGRGLVERYLSLPHHTVIGSVRSGANDSPNKYDDLLQSHKGENSRLILVNIDSASLEDPAKAIQAAKAAGITKIDVVIANAGTSPPPGPLNDAPISDIAKAFNVNTLSPIALYTATRPFLQKSERPRWLSVSSAAGSIGNLEAHQAHFVLPYGLSKAALNFFTLAVHASEKNLIAYTIHPG